MIARPPRPFRGGGAGGPEPSFDCIAARRSRKATFSSRAFRLPHAAASASGVTLSSLPLPTDMFAARVPFAAMRAVGSPAGCVMHERIKCGAGRRSSINQDGSEVQSLPNLGGHDLLNSNIERQFPLRSCLPHSPHSQIRTAPADLIPSSHTTPLTAAPADSWLLCPDNCML